MLLKIFLVKYLYSNMANKVLHHGFIVDEDVRKRRNVCMYVYFSVPMGKFPVESEFRQYSRLNTSQTINKQLGKIC